LFSTRCNVQWLSCIYGAEEKKNWKKCLGDKSAQKKKGTIQMPFTINKPFCLNLFFEIFLCKYGYRFLLPVYNNCRKISNRDCKGVDTAAAVK